MIFDALLRLGVCTHRVYDQNPKQTKSSYYTPEYCTDQSVREDVNPVKDPYFRWREVHHEKIRGMIIPDYFLSIDELNLF